MFQNILVPVDSPERHQSAVEIAVRMAGGGSATLTLLHVIETLADATYDEFQDFYGEMERRAMAGINDLILDYQDRVRIRTAIAYGRRAQEILRFSRENAIDLIVMSSHRMDPDNPATGWGTISHKVGILSSCPVLLVK